MDKFLKCYRSTGALHRTSKSALSGERNSGVISPYNIRNKRNRVFRPFSLLHKTPLGCKCSCTANTMHPHDRTRIISLRGKRIYPQRSIRCNIPCDVSWNNEERKQRKLRNK